MINPYNSDLQRLGSQVLKISVPHKNMAVTLPRVWPIRSPIHNPYVLYHIYFLHWNESYSQWDHPENTIYHTVLFYDYVIEKKTYSKPKMRWWFGKLSFGSVVFCVSFFVIRSEMQRTKICRVRSCV